MFIKIIAKEFFDQILMTFFCIRFKENEEKNSV